MTINVISLSGMKFGRLVVLERSANTINGQASWICRCECGNITHPITGSNLRKGKTKSCGCLRTRHGEYDTRLYEVWHSMKNRCYCTTNHAYQNYGGRGITVCDEWLNDFVAFKVWAMAHGYDPIAPRGKCTLDRIDVNGNYCPDNCRWVTMKVQQNNRRNNVCRRKT